MIEGFLGILSIFYDNGNERFMLLSGTKRNVSGRKYSLVLSTFSGITSIKDKLNNVRESQRARGIETEGSFIVKVKSILPVLFPVIISSMTGIEDKTLAMDARAFEQMENTQHFAELLRQSFLRN